MLLEAYNIDMLIEEGRANNYRTDQICKYTKIGNCIFNISNIFDSYIDILKDLCVLVKLTDKELYRYRYHPKMLSLDLYGTEELYILLLKLNNMSHEIEFTNREVYVLKRTDLEILNTLLIVNSEDVEINHNSVFE